MKNTILWLSLLILAALRPLTLGPIAAGAVPAFPGWPSELQGNQIYALPLTEREEAFARDFPGRIGRFSDGTREIILRWVTQDTRKLHPASDCFRGAGYAVHPLPVRVDRVGDYWSCFAASARGASMRVCERIRGVKGESFSDTSAWFWAALLGESKGPWWAETIAEPL